VQLNTVMVIVFIKATQVVGVFRGLVSRPRNRDLLRRRANVITDVATMPATSVGTLAVAGIHARLEHQSLLPRGPRR
jgi:hypothetical protein